MSGANSRLVGLALGAAVFATSTAGGITLGLLADGTTPTLLALCAEPALWFALFAVAGSAFWARRPALGTSILIGWLVLVAAIRVPVLSKPTADVRHLDPSASACRDLVSPPKGPVRVATWNTWNANATEIADAVRAIDADIVVLQEVASAEVIAEAASGADMDHVFFPTMGHQGTAILSREGFQACDVDGPTPGGDALWTLALPTTGDRRAAAVLSYPRAAGGLVPVIGLHLDRPGHISELMGWADRVQLSADRVAGWSRALGRGTTVVLGDTNTHGTFRHFLGTMQGVGLAAAPARPTWPARLGVVPTLPLYHLDRAWHGDAWRLVETRTMRVGSSDHLALRVELAPAPRGNATR